MTRQQDSRIEVIDPIRGVAIVCVFLFHAVGGAYSIYFLPWGHYFREFSVSEDFLALTPLTLGGNGVAIFFAVSGFCIHWSFLHTPHWHVFFWRRFVRIYPPYFLLVIGLGFLYPPTRLSFESPVDFFQILFHLLLIHNLDHRTFYGLNGAFWSIAVEVQLYVLYPVFSRLTSKFGWRRTLSGIAALEFTLRLTDGLLLTNTGAGLRPWLGLGSPLFYWFSWSIGAYAAERYLRGKPLRLTRSQKALCVAAAICCGFIKPLSSMPFPAFAVLTATVISNSLHKSSMSLGVRNAIWHHFGVIGVRSYSIYLLHMPVIQAVLILSVPASFTPLTTFWICLASWIFIFYLAGIYYRYVEVQSVQFGKQLQRKVAKEG